MPANTPVYGWPYPVGTDRVADGDNAIQDLAEAVETTLDTVQGTIPDADTTTAITFGANVAVDAALGTSRIDRVGNLAVFRWAFTITGAIAANATMATLPVGWRPSMTYYGTFTVVSSSTGVPGGIYVDSAGNVKCNVANSAAADCIGEIVYII